MNSVPAILCGFAIALILIFAFFTPTLRVKGVFRFDEIQRHLRLFRVMWERGVVGDGHGYSAKLAVGFRPKLFHWDDGRLTIFGLRIHYCRSYGGTFV